MSARVSGRVQGVGFRHFTRTQAQGLGLRGWVRNERDGTVRLVAEGDRQNLEQLLHALEHGPGLARVENVAVDWEETAGEFSDFTVR